MNEYNPMKAVILRKIYVFVNSLDGESLPLKKLYDFCTYEYYYTFITKHTGTNHIQKYDRFHLN